ncbi:Actin-Like Protein 6B [Manis pentadactyla]|nr:Actin-Like Protein 6B [Manis pentadactyla]
MGINFLIQHAIYKTGATTVRHRTLILGSVCWSGLVIYSLHHLHISNSALCLQFIPKRRGEQRTVLPERDFMRPVLPALTSLSRYIQGCSNFFLGTLVSKWKSKQKRKLGWRKKERKPRLSASWNDFSLCAFLCFLLKTP